MKITINDRAQKRLEKGHPWIFKSDLLGNDLFQKIETLPPGIVAIQNSKRKFLGQALFSPHSQITLRILTQKEEPIEKTFWKDKILKSHKFRKSLNLHTNAFRLIHGESDGIPSFILDQYANAYSFQILSAGLETQRESLLECLKEIFNPELIVERNDVSVRALEKLPLVSQVVEGTGSTCVSIQQGALHFEVDLLEGQKTGAFLDQRDNRIQAGIWAKGKKRVLDAFAYQGWFSCEMASGAETVLALDQSESACQQISENAERNGFKNIEVRCMNVFDYLKNADQNKERFDCINLDPPAFVKSRLQLKQALKGYKEINLRAMKLLEPNGILITSSCSHHLSEEDFLKVLHEAALDSKRKVQMIGIGQQAADHPVLLGFPESKYLKCFVLRVL